MKKRKDFGPIQDKLDVDKKTSKPYFKFSNSFKKNSPVTEKSYMESVDQFFRYAHIDSYLKLCEMKPEDRQDLIEEWIISMNHLTYGNANLRWCGLNRFCQMNRLIVWETPILAFFPGNDHIKAGGVPYTTEEIHMMLEVSKPLRSKSLILFFSSTGCRPGGIHDVSGHLQLKHIIPQTDGCAAVIIYAGTVKAYIVFLTAEAYTMLKAYFTFREEKYKEKLTDESPVFANEKYLTTPGYKGNHYMSNRSVTRVLGYVLKAAGTKRTKITGEKFDKALTYGFRKRFNVIFKIDNNINSNLAEKLMGHSVTIPLDNAYLPADDPRVIAACFREFKKGMKELAISQEANLRVENMTLKEEDTKTTREKVLQVFDLAEADMGDFTEFMNQKRKDRKYK